MGIIEGLNKAFDSRVRLGIMSVLMVNETVDYNSLKKLLDLTDGNLASHIKALEKLKYIIVFKQFLGKKPHTSYQVSELGKKEFAKHLENLEKILKRQL